MKLITYHKVHYKESERATEQEIRCDLIKDKKPNDYALQVLSDCKKKIKRSDESKHVILMLLDIDQNLYEASINNFGDEKELEEEIYREYIREESKSNEGRKVLERGREIRDAYARQLNLAAGRFALSEAFKEKIAKNLPDQKVIKQIPRMIAIDYMYNEYKTTDFEIDVIMQNEEDGNI
eukprot:TRINITY_DN4468_c0_g1_i1.p2 TRINITY_DN4468_c0_g1~~TRINITY_DN4468_c0_g1_i1.p2  ORF type:complete len:180 (-),score=70.36 TRINITY_DN4468_c0_g1_i1:92-631(-)